MQKYLDLTGLGLYNAGINKKRGATVKNYDSATIIVNTIAKLNVYITAGRVYLIYFSGGGCEFGGGECLTCCLVRIISKTASAITYTGINLTDFSTVASGTWSEGSFEIHGPIIELY